MDSMCTLHGNLIKDPELRFTQAGKPVASFAVAVNRKFQVGAEWQEEVSFFNCVAWGDLGDHVAASVSKGDRIVIVGRLVQRQYEDKDGNKRSAVEVNATDVAPSLRWANAKVMRVARDEQPLPAPVK